MSLFKIRPGFTPTHQDDAQKLARIKAYSLLQNKGINTLPVDQNRIRNIQQQSSRSLFYVAQAPKFRNNYAPREGDYSLTGYVSFQVKPFQNDPFLKTLDKELFVDNLYAVKSDHPTGSILLSHTIQHAKKENYEAIALISVNQNVEWFEQRGLFEVDQDYTLYGDTEKRMILYRNNFDKALENIGDQLENKVVIKKQQKISLI